MGMTYNRFNDIAAIVREMSDDEAFDAMITENLQRKDVDPIEEAFAFSQLIQKGNTAEEVAARFGKSIRFVQDRVKLNNLIPDLMRAVRDGKMPIVSAMMIAKLDEENQGKFFKQYGDSYHGLSKTAAEGFLSSLFMTIDKSIWYRSGDKADEDFEGSCGRKCSECTYNTANHGCLFWEMKSNDAGRCTDRARFDAKTLDYQLSRIDAMAPVLVRENEPLTFGKTVLCIRGGLSATRPPPKNALRASERPSPSAAIRLSTPTMSFRANASTASTTSALRSFSNMASAIAASAFGNGARPTSSLSSGMSEQRITTPSAPPTASPTRCRESSTPSSAKRTLSAPRWPWPVSRHCRSASPSLNL